MADGNAVKREDGPDDTETPEGVGLVRARDIIGDLVARASYGNERIVITRHGRQVAALVGMRDLERLRALDAVA